MQIILEQILLKFNYECDLHFRLYKLPLLTSFLPLRWEDWFHEVFLLSVLSLFHSDSFHLPVHQADLPLAHEQPNLTTEAVWLVKTIKCLGLMRIWWSKTKVSKLFSMRATLYILHILAGWKKFSFKNEWNKIYMNEKVLLEIFWESVQYDFGTKEKCNNYKKTCLNWEIVCNE